MLKPWLCVYTDRKEYTYGRTNGRDLHRFVVAETEKKARKTVTERPEFTGVLADPERWNAEEVTVSGYEITIIPV